MHRTSLSVKLIFRSAYFRTVALSGISKKGCQVRRLNKLSVVLVCSKQEGEGARLLLFIEARELTEHQAKDEAESPSLNASNSLARGQHLLCCYRILVVALMRN